MKDMYPDNKWLLTWTLVTAVVAAIQFSACHHVPAPTAAQGERWIDYSAKLNACDTLRDAGTDGREAAFEACVHEKRLER